MRRKHLENLSRPIKLTEVSKPRRKRSSNERKTPPARYSAKRATRAKRPETQRRKLRAADVSGPLRVRESAEDTAGPELRSWTSIDLFCGAGGITEGCRRAGFQCLYANDINQWAIETFRANHPTTLADASAIESVDVRKLRTELGVRKGHLDVLVGGPPCQGFSINAPERFLEDERNSLFRHYVRFLDEFQSKTLLFENVPGTFLHYQT
jgi:DNA (cytosine-5)-methyltransferase 1